MKQIWKNFIKLFGGCPKAFRKRFCSQKLNITKKEYGLYRFVKDVKEERLL
jgi:hypothetical protein